MAGFKMPNINFNSFVGKAMGKDDSTDPFRDVLIQVMVDESTDPEFIMFARDMLRSKNDNVSLRISSYYADVPVLAPGVDLVVVLANESYVTGTLAALANSSEVPCAVLAQKVDTVVMTAQNAGTPLDLDDVIALEAISAARVPFGAQIDQVVKAGQDALNTIVNVASIPFGNTKHKIDLRIPTLGERNAGYVDMFSSLADWVMRRCPEIRDAFADAFEFARLAHVRFVTRRTAYQNAAAAAIFFTPGADLPVMTANQVKMLIQIEESYGTGLDKKNIPEVVVIGIAALLFRSLARMLSKSFPMLTWFIKVGVGYLATMIMGHFINLYVDAGRPLPNIKLPWLKDNDDTIEVEAEQRSVTSDAGTVAVRADA